MITKTLDKNKHSHVKSGRYIKSFVYGGLDGVITTFAVVAGVAGASLSPSVVLILGFANLAADGISMAVGDYLSTKAEKEYGKNERKKEAREMIKSPKLEKKELIKIYLKQGFKRKDADTIAKIVCKNKDVCIDIMLADELGIGSTDGSAIKNGSITFGSFVLFGFIPLLAYILARGMIVFEENTFLVASILTGLTLFLLGAIKIKITGKNWFKSGIEVLLIGGLTAIVAFFIGRLISGLT